MLDFIKIIAIILFIAGLLGAYKSFKLTEVGLLKIFIKALALLVVFLIVIIVWSEYIN